MKRAHRTIHHIVWISLPVLLLAVIWVGFSIHGSADIMATSGAMGASE